MKKIIVGCVLAALLMVPVAAFAAPSAAAAGDAAVPEQKDVLNTGDVAGGEDVLAGAEGDDVLADAESDDVLAGAEGDDALANADGEQGTVQDGSESMSTGPSALYYIVGGVVIALGVGFYIALTIKGKRH